MKSKIKVFLLVFTVLGLLFTACNKSEDLVTDDAKTGGLVIPTSSVPYKLGATPTVALNVTVPMGPGISTIEVYNKYYALGTGSVSNEVLMSTIDVASANAAEEIVKTARETKTHLIAMATHGRSGIGRWAVGSVTDKVIKLESQIPVLAVLASGKEEQNPVITMRSLQSLVKHSPVLTD